MRLSPLSPLRIEECMRIFDVQCFFIMEIVRIIKSQTNIPKKFPIVTERELVHNILDENYRGVPFVHNGNLICSVIKTGRVNKVSREKSSFFQCTLRNIKFVLCVLTRGKDKNCTHILSIVHSEHFNFQLWDFTSFPCGL